MQAKKAKQLLKARLARERQIYEMRKRAELKAAVSDLERPWEVVSRAAPNSSALFSVSADEQLKVLADRFQKPGGFDLWSEDDGPQLFETPDGLPTSRFFPKGVVHSIKPYGRVVREGEEEKQIGESRNRVVNDGLRNGRGNKKGGFRDSGDAEGSVTVSGVGSRNSRGGERNGVDSSRRNRGGKLGNGSFARESQESGDKNAEFSGSKPTDGGENERDHRWGKNGRGGGKRIDGNGAKLKDLESRKMGSNMRSNDRQRSIRGGDMGRFRRSHSEDVYDMRLQGDGSYGFTEESMSTR